MGCIKYRRVMYLRKQIYGFLGDYPRKMAKVLPTPSEMYKIDKKSNDCFKKATGVLFECVQSIRIRSHIRWFGYYSPAPLPSYSRQRRRNPTALKTHFSFEERGKAAPRWQTDTNEQRKIKIFKKKEEKRKKEKKKHAARKNA